MTDPVRRRRVPLLALLPLAVFLGLAALFYGRIGAGDASLVPSALIGREVPDFTLEPIAGLLRNGAPLPGLTAAGLGKGVTVVNVFASWCVPCRTEHPLLMQLSADRRFRLVGINYKDAPDQAQRFLAALGNPFSAAGSDRSGRVGIDWGVYGVPETYVVAGGRILFKHIGPLDAESLETRLMPEIEKALAQPVATP